MSRATLNKTNVLHSVPMISARDAALKLRLTNATLSRAIAGSIVRPQARIEGKKRPSFGFEPDYVDEIDEILPSERGSGVVVFTPEIVEAIEKINAKWRKRYPGMGS